MKKEITTVRCPRCKTAVPWTETSQFRPFCSKQCQMIDFGEWANEENAIPDSADSSQDEYWSESSS